MPRISCQNDENPENFFLKFFFWILVNNVNAATKFDQYTSLIDASLIGNFKIVQTLIEKGANTNATTKVRY